MQHNWSDASTRPPKLYRTIHPRSSTRYDPTHGFTSPLADTKANYITSIPPFLSAITAHRNQDIFPRGGGSPFISTFADLEEAESWAIAVEDVFGRKAYAVEIDVECDAMKGATMWRVADVLEECGVGLGGQRYHGMGVGRGGRKWNGNWMGGNRDELDRMRMRDSEWLILYRVPGVAMRVLKSSTQIRKERAWQPINPYTIYTPSIYAPSSPSSTPASPNHEHEPLNHELEQEYNHAHEPAPLRYDPSDLFKPIEWTQWEKCPCESQALCPHPGPFTETDPLLANARIKTKESVD